MPRGRKAWTIDDERQLLELVNQGVSRPIIAKALERTVAAIEGRLNVLRNRRPTEN